MLEHLQGNCVRPTPFSPPPISSNMDERAIRIALERRACLSFRRVLQLKLQQRRTREALVSCRVMPQLKSSAALHKQRRGLEPAQVLDTESESEAGSAYRDSGERSVAEIGEDYHKRKIRSRSESSEAIRMHIMDEKATKFRLQAIQFQQKNMCLAKDLNNKITQRPGPMELIHKNILPVDSCFRQAIIERQFPEASGGNSSCDEDSNDSLSPRQSESREHPMGIEPARSSAEKLAGSNLPSPVKVPPSALPVQLNSAPLNSVQKTCGNSQIRYQRRLISDRLTQKHKKTKDNKPKIKKLKYHQYIPPDKKRETEPVPDLDSSYAKILQQQQLFLQLQILSQQHNYHTPQPAPPNRDQDDPSSFLSSTSSPPEPSSTAPTVPSAQHIHICPTSAPSVGTKVLSLHSDLGEMKVAELKCELKLRRLPVSGTRKDLIDRLRKYQELSQDRDAIPSPTAGGTTEPELKTAGTSSKTGETSPQQLLRCDGTMKPFPQPSMLNGANPEEISFNSEPPRELKKSSYTDLSLQPFTPALFPAAIKHEPRCSSPAPCHFSLKSASLQKHSLVSSAAPATTAAAPPVTIDKDRMLQEKDKQIAELTRMLWQNQRLVEELKMQLENGYREEPEAEILKRVKEEPPDKVHEAFSTSPLSFDPQISVISHEKEVTKVTIKEEAIEAEIGSEIEVQSPDTLLQPCTPTQQTQVEIHFHLQPEQRSLQKQVYLQHSARQLAQHQVIKRLLLMQQHDTKKQQHTVQSHNQAQRSQQNPHPEREKRSQKLNHQKQLQQSEQHYTQLLQTRPKQQVLQSKKLHQDTGKKQPIQTQTRIQLQQQDLLKNYTKPAPISDSERKNTLTPLTDHITRDQGSYSEGKESSQILLQTQNKVQQASVEQPLQEAACLSVPSSLQSPPTWKNTSSPFYQTEMFPGMNVLLSPVSLDPVKTAASPSHDKPRDEEDFIDIILQAGDMANTVKVAQNVPVASPSPSPLRLPLSPVSSPSVSTLQPGSPPQLEPWTPAKSTDYKQALGLSGSGRLEDFLESTTGKPLLGVEPGGLLTLIDELHSQMLCTSSILDIPPAPMDALDTDGDMGQRLDRKEWLGFTIGGGSEWETPTLAPLVPQTPPSVFSVDFMSSSDLHMDWDS
ncbi:myocardin-related transcription factor A-like [Fundulus diaphanus]